LQTLKYYWTSRILFGIKFQTSLVLRLCSAKKKNADLAEQCRKEEISSIYAQAWIHGYGRFKNILLAQQKLYG